MINLKPSKCNICGGEVIHITNDTVYGRKYGSGFCYLCTGCKAYVGTHGPSPTQAFGLLANEEMRKWKVKCHNAFDPLWKSNKSTRGQWYKRLAEEMKVHWNDCHFGYFDLKQLKQAYAIIESWKDERDGK